MSLRVQLTGAVLTLVLAEVVARVWLAQFADPSQRRKYALFTDLPAAERLWSPHPYLGYIPTPGYRWGRTSHNSLGFRGREFPRAKPERTSRIAVLGGSTVYGIGIDDDADTFPAQLERVLREEFDRPLVEVINAGAGAYTSWESLVDLEFRILDLSPDLVIVYHNVNDVHSRLTSTYRSDNSGRRQSWAAPAVPWWERSALLRIVGRRRGWSRQVGLEDFVDTTHFGYIASNELLQRNPPIYFERNLRSMVAVARAHNVKIMLATWAHSPNRGDYAATAAYELGFAQNNQVVKDVGESLALPVFDFAAVMPGDVRYWSDGRHVNRDGARLQAQAFARFIVEHELTAP